MRVLLIEDNEGDVALIRQGCTTSPRPVDLQVMQDGAEALDFLFRRGTHTQVLTPDLILLDLQLPQKTGFEILQELEQDPDLKFLPVVVVTGSNNKADVNRCYELGANAYVVKPSDPGQYIAFVQAIIEFWYGCQFRELSTR
jgi:two-component system, chemotaxis family, response regulator Rcp1